MCAPLTTVVEHPAWADGEHGSAIKDDFSVDDDSRHPFGILVRFIECGSIPHTSRIKDGDIRFHSRPDQTTIGKAEALSRK